VGDLPSYDYQVPVQTLTEEVTLHLDKHPHLPGVILLDEGRLHSALPRSLIFERLGHRYGVELFLRKPILELQQFLRNQTYTIPDHMSVKEAVQFALSRKPEDLYAPLIILYEDGLLRLLDMHTLLLAQSQILDNANNIFSSMSSIEEAIRANQPFSMLIDLTVDTIARLVPYHRAGIFVKPSRWIHLPQRHSLVYRLREDLAMTAPFRAVMNASQPIHITNTATSPLWQDVDSLGNLRVWLGVPIQSLLGFEGVLSLGRLSASPFNVEEVELSKTFAGYLGLILSGSHHNPRFSFYMDRLRKRTSWLERFES